MTPRTGAASQRKYPAPKEAGGRLIRRVVKFLREEGTPLPLTSHILVAASAGSDSTALALLLARYGRKIIPDPRCQITLLHINHGWRGEDSERDEDFVRELAGRLGVGFMTHRLTRQAPAGASWEEFARRQRKEIFRTEAEESGALVFTAHTADDVAETMLWRIFTGGFERERAGILPRHGPEVRPFLEVRKSELQAFLREERCEWREDRTNHEGRFLRSRMRRELMPAIEALFPRGLTHLLSLRKPAEGGKKASKKIVRKSSGKNREIRELPRR